MPVNLQTFTDFAAQHTVHVAKNIHVHGADGQMEVGSASFKQTLGRDLSANQRTMAAFRNCLSNEYGVFGEHAFDAVLGARADVGKTLRAKDIASVMRVLNPTDTGAVRQTMIASRFANEASRQAETNPRAVAANVTGALKERLQACFENDVFFARAVRGCENQAELSRLIEGKVNAILDMNELPGARRTLAVDAAGAGAPAGIPAETPHGLRAFAAGVDTFGVGETSVEDRVRSGAFGVGMRVNESGVKYVFEKLKTSGVEPGFIVRKDWTAADTQTMMTDGTDLDQVARTVLEQRLGRPLTAQDDVRALKAQHFVAIRDAAMAGAGNVRRLTERHIVKLDYNENDRRVRHDAAHIGTFRLPVRNAIKGGAFKGAFFRAFRLTTANEASAGAVAEALANDLTRAMGVPTQELSLVKGRYSDGHEKLMLVSKFAHGYKDFDGNFLQDGRLVPGRDAAGNVVQPEDIGRYKAMFLLLADRDAVGSHGQNKGLVNGHFFAIDPGHSLEGNGAALEIHDDFSFKDTQGGVFEKRFLNFSVFDDSNRSEKLKGMVAIRDAFVRGDFDNIFNEYEARFPADEGGDPALGSAIRSRLGEMRAEFNGQYDRMMGVFGGQLAVYDHFLALTPGDDATACRVIDAVENLERLTSPTVATSKHGEVQLRHLEVTPETRVPWKVRVAPDGAVVYSCDRLPEDRKPLLANMLQGAGVMEVEADAGGAFTFTVPQANLPAFLGAFTEDAVRQAVGG